MFDWRFVRAAEQEMLRAFPILRALRMLPVYTDREQRRRHDAFGAWIAGGPL